jgi:uncharacterized protein (TIGR02147 family)
LSCRKVKEANLKTSIFQTLDYREFLQTRLEWHRKGHGKLSRLAKFLGVHPSRLSRILKGPDHPTAEQAFVIGQFLNIAEDETLYLMELVNLQRAGNAAYKEHILQKLETMRNQVRTAAPLTNAERPMTSAEERIYYSSYQYGAVWLCSMIDGLNTTAKISERLQIDKKTVEKICDFLVSVNLCHWSDKKIMPGSRLLKLDSNSAHLENFLSHWRMHAIETIPHRAKTDFFFSQPMAIGREAAEKIKSLLKQNLVQVTEILKENPADTLVCLNIDFYEV